MIATQNRNRREKPKAVLLKPLKKELKIGDEVWTAHRGDSHFEFVNPSRTKKYIVPFETLYQHIIDSPPWEDYPTDPVTAGYCLEAFLRDKAIYKCFVNSRVGYKMKWRWAVKYVMDVLKPVTH